MGTVDTVLTDHVTLRVQSVDRIGVAGYIPSLMYEGGLVRFLLHRGELLGRGLRVPSPALLGHQHDRLVADLDRLVAASGVPVLRFPRGESKEMIARPYQQAAAAADAPGLVLVGKAQERMHVWRGWKDDTSSLSSKNHPHFCFSRQSAVPDHWYFYLWDDQWGPVFIKLSTHAPYGLWVACNGHEWAKRQLTHTGVAFDALDNGLWRVADPAAAHRICARLGSGHVRQLINRWLPELPSPLDLDDRRAGFGWAWSVRQLEISDTAVFDQPAAGRAWFETAIRDHLDLGRPDKVRIVFDRQLKLRGKNVTPGQFATSVITPGVYPRLEIRYKTSGAKAYFKEQRALRVETTINNPDHFGLRKTLNAQNWKALRRVGADVNRRFLAALGEGQDRWPDPAWLNEIVGPSVHDGQRAPGLRFGDPRVMALLAALASFEHVMAGLTNKGLCEHMAALHDPDYNPRQATYDLRRLRLKGLIERVPGTHTYRVTDRGRMVATFFTKLAARVVVPALTDFEAPCRPPRRAPAPLTAAWRAYDKELTNLIRAAGLHPPRTTRPRRTNSRTTQGPCPARSKPRAKVASKTRKGISKRG